MTTWDLILLLLFLKAHKRADPSYTPFVYDVFVWNKNKTPSKYYITRIVYTATQLHVPVKVFRNETPAAGGAACQIKINFHVVFGCGWKSFRRIEFIACCFVHMYTISIYACEFNKILLLWRKRKLTEQENRFGPEPRPFRDLWRRKSVFRCARASCSNIYAAVFAMSRV